MATATEASADRRDMLLDRIKAGEQLGRSPLFILGSGISWGRVPTLQQLGEWLEVRLEKKDEFLSSRAHALAAGPTPARRQVAELFEGLQRPGWSDLWREFSLSFLVKGFTLPTEKFGGILGGIKTSESHEKLAELVTANRAFLVSLNFDGLEYRALANHAGESGRTMVLHRHDQLEGYFSASPSPVETSIPEHINAVIQIRGDVFFATCTEPACPTSRDEYPLYRLPDRRTDEDALVCPVCRGKTLRLKFDFPGRREKEELAWPMLVTLQRFLGAQISAVVLVGISGRWDEYLLRWVFDLAIDRGLIVADVRPPSNDESGDRTAEYQAMYFPSLTASLDRLRTRNPTYLRIEEKADDVLPTLVDELNGR